MDIDPNTAASYYEPYVPNADDLSVLGTVNFVLFRKMPDIPVPDVSGIFISYFYERGSELLLFFLKILITLLLVDRTQSPMRT